MQENIALIKEINELRRETKNMRDRQRAREDKALQRRKKKSLDAASTGRRQEIEVNMEMQQEQIRALKAQLAALKGGGGGDGMDGMGGGMGMDEIGLGMSGRDLPPIS